MQTGQQTEMQDVEAQPEAQPETQPETQPEAEVVDWKARYEDLEKQHQSLKEKRALLDSVFSDDERTELENLRAYKKELDAELAQHAEKEMSEKYADILDAPEEVSEEWIQLVEKGVDVEKAAAFIRHTHQLGKPVTPADPPKPSYLSGAAAVDPGDRPAAGGRSPVRRSFDDMLLEAADVGLSKKR